MYCKPVFCQWKHYIRNEWTNYNTNIKFSQFIFQGKNQQEQNDLKKTEKSEKTPEWDKKLREKEKVTKRSIKNGLNKLHKQVTKKRTEKKTIHNHIKITQLHKFKCMKDELKEGEIIVSDCFSENYALKQQNEIMAVHWSNE